MRNPETDISLGVGIAAKTLRKHFRDELDTGHIKADVKVAAIPRRSVTPIRRMASMMGRVFAANKAAFSISAFRPSAPHCRPYWAFKPGR